MAQKIEVIDNALVVTNTGTGVISLSEPAKDYWYKEFDLQIGRITFYDANGIKGDEQITAPNINLSDAVNKDLVAFTESTFRDFCTVNLTATTIKSVSGDSPKGNKSSTVNSTDILLGISETFTGEWEEIIDYTGIGAVILTGNITDGVLWFDLSTDGGTTFVSIPRAIIDSTNNLPKYINRLETHIRVRYINGTTAQTGFFRLLTTFSNGGVLGINLPVEATLSSDNDAEIIRSIIAGKEVSGHYHNVSVVETTNDLGTYHNLQVVNGARPSQLPGRLPIDIISDTEVSSLQHTVTSGKTFYVTDILMTVVNTDTGTSGYLKIEDAITAGVNPLKIPIRTAEPSNNISTITVMQHSFIEPIIFTVGVWFNEDSGVLMMSGVINGYEE